MILVDEIREIQNLVNPFFKEEEKTNKWLMTANALLGGMTPIEMLKDDRKDKLVKWIKTCLDENDRTYRKGGL